MTPQPGYDALADLYDRTFPDPFVTPLERRVVDTVADLVCASDPAGSVIDVGCGTGGVAAHLAARGLRVHGVDPSAGMLAITARRHPHLSVAPGDADLRDLDLGEVRGIVARFSLIHVKPDRVREILADWAGRLPSGAVVLIAMQSADHRGVHEFDHAVARAWRWHADDLGEAVATAGLHELWRTVSRPDDLHRFPELHLVAERR